MYRRPKFLEELIRIREEMAREADYDTDLFSELVRSGRNTDHKAKKAPGRAEGAIELVKDRARRSK